MRAITVTGKNIVELTKVTKPLKAEPEHLLVKMRASAINSGDKLFIQGAFPRGIPESIFRIAGVSGVGTVVEIGSGVPDRYKGKNITIYRSLLFDNNIMGTWSEYAHLHYLHCAILPDDLDMVAYSGSLVNAITAYSFLKQAMSDGHKAIVCTAGNSATGIAMLGCCLAYDFPIISLVRNEKAKKELESLGAKKILVQTDPDFKHQLANLCDELRATAIFDGVGGSVLNNMIDSIPTGSTIYCYGFLGDQTPVAFHTTILMRGITIRGFSNFRTPTVQNHVNLLQALNDISSIIEMPHFRTKVGKEFSFEDFHEALSYSSGSGKKAIILASS